MGRCPQVAIAAEGFGEARRDVQRQGGRMTAPQNANPAGHAVADAPKGNWTDSFAPDWLKPWLRLIRADRPIGVWLLLLPCWWSVALAGLAGGAAFPDVWLLLLFAIGAFAMRSAGCIYNDILDRDIDKMVERTRSRPLASGQISVRAAAGLMFALCLIGLGVLLQFNTFAIFLGFASIGIVLVYPLMKRVTYWPQAVLGLAFSWGALMGWAAVFGELELAPVLLYTAAVAWTIGYDTIYAHQDREDDAVIGLKSTALRFGTRTREWLAVFYGLTIALLAYAGVAAGATFWFFAGLACGAVHLAWQAGTLNIDDSRNCLARFRSNHGFGAIIFAAIVLDMAMRALLR
jgi:4-hydroxybenzoate polyprenyltransferase